MKISDLESRLQDHAKIMKSTIAAPFSIESEELNMSKKNFSVKRTVLLAAAIVCLIGTTVFAAYQLMSAKDVTNTLGDTKLAASFDNSNYAVKTVTDGKYSASILGVVSGENLSDFKGSAWNIVPERTYAVIAVAKTDKTPMSVDEPIIVTPLIQGLKPWEYNIASMHGSYTEKVIDGVLYRIIEMDSIECFANQKIYMAIADNMFISNEHFIIEENSGEITANKEYKGTNILFELDVDKSKANPEKASNYLIKLNKEWSEGTDNVTKNNPESNVDSSEKPTLIITEE